MYCGPEVQFAFRISCTIILLVNLNYVISMVQKTVMSYIISIGVLALEQSCQNDSN